MSFSRIYLNVILLCVFLLLIFLLNVVFAECHYGAKYHDDVGCLLKVVQANITVLNVILLNVVFMSYC
jgi:hypothetical protein